MNRWEPYLDEWAWWQGQLHNTETTPLNLNTVGSCSSGVVSVSSDAGERGEFCYRLAQARWPECGEATVRMVADEIDHLTSLSDWTKLDYTMIGTLDMLVEWGWVETRQAQRGEGYMAYRYLEVRTTEAGAIALAGGEAQHGD